MSLKVSWPGALLRAVGRGVSLTTGGIGSGEGDPSPKMQCDGDSEITAERRRRP